MIHCKPAVLTLLIGMGMACVDRRAIADESVPPSLDQTSSYSQPVGNGNGQPCLCYSQSGRPEDLTLANFFSAGWDEDWAKQVRPTGTPNLALLRVQTNFMEREFRLNYFAEEGVNSPKTKNLIDSDELIAWSFNRRFMIEVTGLYEWTDPRTGNRETGGAPGMAARFQLVDTESSSYSLNFKAQAPNDELGTTQSTLSYGVAGFEDLAYWFHLDRVGLYYSFLFDSYTGPAEVGEKTLDVAYDVTVAKTITSPDTPIFGTLTLFLENYAQTDLDGSHDGRTIVSITPGVRFNLGQYPCIKMGQGNWLLFGADLPVSDYHPWNTIYRVTYIKNF